MGKVVSLLGALFVYLCIGTVLTAVGGYFYLTFSGALDQQKLSVMLAVARGEPIASQTADAKKPSAADSFEEQPAFSDWEQSRDLRSRNLELRELSAKSGVSAMLEIKNALTEEHRRYDNLVKQFKLDQQKQKEKAQSLGIANMRSWASNAKPKQVHDQLLQMLEKDEIDDVVAILSEMPEAKRVKIAAEFKTPEDAEKLGEILRLIRRGEPEASLIDQALNQVQQK